VTAASCRTHNLSGPRFLHLHLSCSLPCSAQYGNCLRQRLDFLRLSCLLQRGRAPARRNRERTESPSSPSWPCQSKEV
jgi:hypothetical protein